MKGRIITSEPAGLGGMPEAGRLHIGMKVQKNGREYPTSVDYFIPAGKYADVFTRWMGERPNTIPIIFYSDDPAISCDEHFVYRDDAGKKVAEGDGFEFKVWNGTKWVVCTVEKYPNLMEIVAQKFPTKKGMESWVMEMTMRFLIPQVQGVFGYWQFSTKGAASSIKNIRNAFDSIKLMRGSVSGIPFDLSVQFAKSDHPGAQSRYPVVSLVANMNRVEEIRAALGNRESETLLLTDNGLK